jgi:hypothetical protein
MLRRGQTTWWRRARRCAGLAVTAALATAGPAWAIPPHPVCDEQFMTINLQRPAPAVEMPLHFEGGQPDGSWTIVIDMPGSLGGTTRDGKPVPERELARLVGSGPMQDPVVPIADPDWRWRLLDGGDVFTYVEITWTTGGATYTSGGDGCGWLRTTTDRGPYWPEPALPGHFPIYTGAGYAAAPPDPDYEAYGKLAHRVTRPSTFRRRRKMRRTAVVPFLMPLEGARTLAAKVRYVGRRGPAWGTAVYARKLSIPDAVQPGARLDVRTRLTRAGRRLGRRLGAKKLAGALAAHGVLDMTSTSDNESYPFTKIYVPMGTCFTDPQRPRSHPCAQTCPPFPHMPTGYLIYGALGRVWGSETCTKGDPLPPEPMS